MKGIKSVEIHFHCELEVLKIMFNKEVNVSELLEARKLADYNENLREEYRLTELEWKILQEAKRTVFDQ